MTALALAVVLLFLSFALQLELSAAERSRKNICSEILWWENCSSGGRTRKKYKKRIFIRIVQTAVMDFYAFLSLRPPWWIFYDCAHGSDLNSSFHLAQGPLSWKTINIQNVDLLKMRKNVLVGARIWTHNLPTWSIWLVSHQHYGLASFWHPQSGAWENQTVAYNSDVVFHTLPKRVFLIQKLS